MENENKVPASQDEIDLNELEQISGGYELTPKLKEKYYKIMRNAMNSGCTKEEFLSRHPECRDEVRTFIENVWEVVEISSFDAAKKHGN